MPHVFPEPIRKLDEADIPMDGLKAYLLQSEHHQILFMHFDSDTDLPEHRHAAQIGFVLEGRIDLNVDGILKSYTQGDRYYIPAGVVHSAKIHAGYADITFFDEPNRYSIKG